MLRALSERRCVGAFAACRAIRQQAAFGGARCRFRLSRARPHEPAEAAPSAVWKTRTAKSAAWSARATCCACARRRRRSSATRSTRPSDVPALAAAWARLPQAAGSLIAEDVSAREIAAVISRELGALDAPRRRARRATDEERSAMANRLAVMRYACSARPAVAKVCSPWIRITRLCLPKAIPDGAADEWFARLGSIVADILHEVGVPYCKGGVMAKNPQWRGSMETWRARIAGWIGSFQSGRSCCRLTFSSICVGVHGDVRLANELWRAAFRCRSRQCRLCQAAGGGRRGGRSGLNYSAALRVPKTAASISRKPAYSASSPRRVCWQSVIICSSDRPPRGYRRSPRSAAAAQRDLEAVTRAQAPCSSISFWCNSLPTCGPACRRATKSRSGR